MFLGRVKGHIVATAKDPGIQGYKLLVIEPLRVKYDDDASAANGEPGAPAGDAPSRGARRGSRDGRFEVTGRAIVAMDMIGAGEDQLVLIVQGSSARMAQGCNQAPTDAVVIGIVDEAVVMGERIN